MTDGHQGAAQPRAVAATVAVVAVAVLVLLVAVWAASTGPDDPFRGDGISPDRVTTDTPSVTETPKDDGQDEAGAPEIKGGSSVLTTIVGLLVLTVAVLLALAALYVLGTALWRLWLLRRLRWRRREHPAELPPLDPVHAVATAMLDDAVDHEDLMTSGTPRNAVVQSWHRFEVQAAGAGVPRKQWETSAEFTLRLLELVEADASAVARLAELYREARFSEHELDEDARVVALEIVRTIHRDLRTLLSGGRL